MTNNTTRRLGSLGPWSLLLAAFLVTTARPAQAGTVNEQLIDDFQYVSAAAARDAWVASGGTPPVEVVVEGGRRALQFRAPFASQPELPRTILDRQVRLDLSAAGHFYLDVQVEPPDCGASVTLYFRSGRGWYGANTALKPEAGWQRLVFPKARFRTEQTPSGWSHVDGIRVSVWRGRDVDCVVRLGRLAAVWHDVVLATPVGPSVDRSTTRFVEDLSNLLTELGLSFDTLPEDDLSAEVLAKRKLVVLPYNPRLSDQAVDALAAFLQKGGKLFACYVLPAKLQPLLGIRRLSFYKPDQPGGLAEVRFTATDVAGLPRSVKQASWNVNQPEVLPGKGRVVGWWYDQSGRPTGRAALVLSDAGAFFSHVVLTDDRDGKRQLLAAVLGHLLPSLWPQMAAHSIRSVGQVGHLHSVRDVVAYVTSSPRRSAAERSLRAGLQAEQQATNLLAAGRFSDAVQAARQARQHLVQAFLTATPSRRVEGRAFWNHSGLGAYPGDWDRTARELAAAGVNMILPNLLWAGRAHYPSDVLPRSQTFQQYGDQLAACLKAAHKYGLEVHVWKVNHNLSGAPREFVEKLKRQGRLQVSHTGQVYNWLCPSNPDNFRLEVESMLEVVRKYPVDGLHFDYIRYPNGDHCYCDGCRRRFEKDTGLKVKNWPDDCYNGPLRQRYRQWRCDQITRLVATVSREAKRIRPGVKISAAVFGRYPQCRDSVGQDWVAWVRAGYLDFVCPMDYTTDDAAFRELVSQQRKLVGGRIPLYPGVGAFRLTPDRMVGQIVIARSLGADGFTVFNLEPNTAADLLSALAAGVGTVKATPPHRR